MNGNNTERTYTATVNVEVADGVLATKRFDVKIEIKPGTVAEIRQQINEGLAILNEQIRLELYRNYRDWHHLVTEGWKKLLPSRDD